MHSGPAGGAMHDDGSFVCAHGALSPPEVELARQVELLLELPPEGPVELSASLLQGAWGLLARLTGEDRAESSLDEVFSGFCLGK